MTAGSAAASLLVLAWAQVGDLTAFYAIWAGIGLTMAAVLYEPAFVVIATWFRDDAERRRALLALTVIAGFASVIYVPLAGWLVETRGWRDALIMLAALLILLTVLPNATLPGRRPDPVDRLPHGQATMAAELDQPAGVPLRRALADQTLWWLVAALVAATLATSTVTVHLVAYLREQHYSPGFAATWTGLTGPCRSPAASWLPSWAAGGPWPPPPPTPSSRSMPSTSPSVPSSPAWP
jgi:MFS family permease